VRAILDPSCICDKVTDDTAERLFAITRISIISNLHNFSIDSDAQAVHDMPAVGGDSESLDDDLIVPIPDVGQPSVWNKKLLDMEELTTKLAKKYVRTFGREYACASVQSSGSEFRSQMSLGDKPLSHRTRSEVASRPRPGLKSVHDLGPQPFRLQI
jgi:hypothetical protein